jgi:hypothetical protein
MDVNIPQYYSDRHWICKISYVHAIFQFPWQSNFKQNSIQALSNTHFSQQQLRVVLHEIISGFRFYLPFFRQNMFTIFQFRFDLVDKFLSTNC